jgi:hypothetical protein
LAVKIGGVIMAKKAKKKDECCSSWTSYVGKRGCDDGGCFGRLLFAIGIYAALNSLGILTGIPTWAVAVTCIGFVLMRF